MKRDGRGLWRVKEVEIYKKEEARVDPWGTYVMFAKWCLSKLGFSHRGWKTEALSSGVGWNK